MSEVLTLFNFSNQSKLDQWKIINDEVMGGVSSGLLQVNTEGNGIFSGHVSLDYNGGFTMAQYNLNPIEVTKYSSFVIRLKGDGKKYQFRCKSSPTQRHSYNYTFITKKTWEIIAIPFQKMSPYFRGNSLELPNYMGEHLAQVAILIGNNTEEDFSLAIDYITIEY